MRSTTSRTSSWTCTRWAATRRTTSRRRPTRSIPFITPDQIRWLETFGRANAARFDERGFAYFIREVYDSFYPGYGESWPIFNGAIGMTYEQASARGLVFTRDDDTTLTYRQGVVHHFNAAITTAYTAAGNRERLLRDFLEYRRSAIAEGEKAATREYVLLPGNDPGMAARLARNLAGAGHRSADGQRGRSRSARATCPPARYLVSAAQPSGRLVRNLLDTHVPQPEAFVKEQDRRRKKRLGDQIYDVTGWSLPALFDVEVVTSAQALTPASTRVSAAPAPAGTALPAAKVAYLLPWGSETPGAVNALLRAGVRVHQASRSLTIGARTYAAGTAIVRVAELGAGQRETLAGIVARHGVPRRRARQRLGRSRHLAGLRRCRGAQGAAHRAGVGRADLEPVGRVGALRARAPLRVHGVARCACRRSAGSTSTRSTCWCCRKAPTPARSTTTRCDGCGSGCAAAARW